MDISNNSDFNSLFTRVFANFSSDIAMKQLADQNTMEHYSLSERIGSAVFISKKSIVVEPCQERNYYQITNEDKTFIINRETYILIQQFDGKQTLENIIHRCNTSKQHRFVLQENIPEHSIFNQTAADNIYTVISTMMRFKLITYLHNSFTVGDTKADRAHMHLTDWDETALMELITFTASGLSYIHLTYRELNGCIQSVSRQIKQYCKKPDSVIAISMKSRLCLCISILAAIQSGIAYICLLPDFPNSQKMNLINKGQCSLVLSDYDHKLAFAPSVHMELSDMYGNCKPLDSMLSDTDEDKDVYICCTSGTTGEPKKVSVTKHGVQNYLHHRCSHYSVNKDNITMQVLNENADAFWGSLFPALISGGCIVFSDLLHRANYEQTCKIIETCRVSNFSATPRILEAIIDVSQSGQLDSLEFIIIGGETVSAGFFDKFYSLKKPIRLINEYGATETTISCCADTDFTHNACRRIGQPICNTGMLVVNDKFEPVPAMTQGEIIVTGPQVAKGLSDSQMCYVGKQLYYRTGDIGYCDQSGSFYYVGRKDNVIKINGVRISLQDIEAVICRFEGVQDVKVIVTESASGQTEKAIAFVCSCKSIHEEELLTFIRENMYLYAIPIEIVFTEHLPVNINGKIDLHNLKSMLTNIPAVCEKNIISLEDIVHTYWCKYLEVEQINHNAIFFETGGNSILLTKMFMDMKENLFSGLKLSDFFNYPTIAKFSAFLETQQVNIEKFQT